MTTTLLRADHISRTALKLSQRVHERFPDSGLYELTRRILELGAVAEIDAPRIARPIYWVRIVGGLVIALIIGIGTSLILKVLSDADQFERVALIDLLEGLEAGTQQFILFGLAIFFLATLEGRIKRGRALRRIHELRSMAHVIDMHQLTKDPDTYRRDVVDTVHSPKRELTLLELMRYLDYCSELLALTSKIAALYIQRFNDAVVLAAVSDVETLCDGLSRKIWQKMTIAGEMSRDAARRTREEQE